jgi:hypothetical protein
MPRYVVLEHDHPHLHWDFMLQWGAVLRTWRLAEPPQPGISIAAEALGDHRAAYLDYEGPVSGGRGRVMRWDGGCFDWRETDTDNRGQLVRVRLDGGRLRGRATLEDTGGGRWRFTLSAE